MQIRICMLPQACACANTHLHVQIRMCERMHACMHVGVCVRAHARARHTLLLLTTITLLVQAIARRVSYHTFKHMLGLDIGFHLEKRTGRVSRILERGPRSFQYIYRAALFVFLPTILELVAVTAVLARSFNPLVRL